MSYTFFSDSGHGWLKVSSSELADLDLLSKITRYSYMTSDGRWVYLEEDRDLTTYLDAIGKNHAGWDKELKGKVKYKNNAYYLSNIRNYPAFDRDVVLFALSRKI